jgi:hypothetical protein
MSYRNIVILALVPGISVCFRADAAITAFWVPVASGDGSVGSMYPAAAITDDPALLGMQTWDLQVSLDGNWTSAGMRATLANGTFYNHPQGGPVRPLIVSTLVYPALQFDTFVTAPTDVGVGAGSPMILGGFPSGEPLSIGGSVISVSWADVFPEAPGSYPIARLTFPLGTIPDILTIDQNPEFSRTSQVMPDSTTAIPEIPEPTTLHFIGLLVALALSKRGR